MRESGAEYVMNHLGRAGVGGRRRFWRQEQGNPIVGSSSPMRPPPPPTGPPALPKQGAWLTSGEGSHFPISRMLKLGQQLMAAAYLAAMIITLALLVPEPGKYDELPRVIMLMGGGGSDISNSLAS